MIHHEWGLGFLSFHRYRVMSGVVHTAAATMTEPPKTRTFLIGVPTEFRRHLALRLMCDADQRQGRRS